MNNNLIRGVIAKKYPNIKKYEIYKNAIVFTDEEGKKLVAKKNNGHNIINIYDYLNSRGFSYIPRIIYHDNNSYIYEYEEDINTPDEQKIADIIKMLGLLHNKTSYYKEITIDEIKEIYEKIENQIKDVFIYYDELINIIETKFYPSPSEYMLSRNCSSIFSCINFCKVSLESWYEIMSKKLKIREVLLHNNLEYDHLIRNNDNILISWNNARRDMPIYDFINLYKKYYNKYDFSHLYKEYISRFSLLMEEETLLFINLFLPWKINFDKNEFSSTNEVAKLCSYLFITDKLFMENKTKYSEE